MTTQEWPENMLARYLTDGGATVDVEQRDDGTVSATCRGCEADQLWLDDQRADSAFWAQQHAERCRAIPRP